MNTNDALTVADRLDQRTRTQLPNGWNKGLLCPSDGCAASAERQKCMFDLGPGCPRHDPDAYEPRPYVEVPDPLCADAAVTIRQQAEEIARLTAELAEARSADQWQPIETVPRDGTHVLLYFPQKGVRAALWGSPDGADADDALWCVDDDKYGPYAIRGYRDGTNSAPTHWQPLPAPPAPQQAAQQQAVGDE